MSSAFCQPLGGYFRHDWYKGRWDATDSGWAALYTSHFWERERERGKAKTPGYYKANVTLFNNCINPSCLCFSFNQVTESQTHFMRDLITRVRERERERERRQKTDQWKSTRVKALFSLSLSLSLSLSSSLFLSLLAWIRGDLLLLQRL